MVHRSMRVAKCHTRSQIVKNRGHADASGQETVVRCNFTMQPLRKSILANACKTADVKVMNNHLLGRVK